MHFLSGSEWYTEPTALRGIIPSNCQKQCCLLISRINPFKLLKTMLFTYKSLLNCISNSQMKVDFTTQLNIFNCFFLNIYTMHIQKCNNKSFWYPMTVLTCQQKPIAYNANSSFGSTRWQWNNMPKNVDAMYN